MITEFLFLVELSLDMYPMMCVRSKVKTGRMHYAGVPSSEDPLEV